MANEENQIKIIDISLWIYIFLGHRNNPCALGVCMCVSSCRRMSATHIATFVSAAVLETVFIFGYTDTDPISSFLRVARAQTHARSYDERRIPPHTPSLTHPNTALASLPEKGKENMINTQQNPESAEAAHPTEADAAAKSATHSQRGQKRLHLRAAENKNI